MGFKMGRCNKHLDKKTNSLKLKLKLNVNVRQLMKKKAEKRTAESSCFASEVKTELLCVNGGGIMHGHLMHLKVQTSTSFIMHLLCSAGL